MSTSSDQGSPPKKRLKQSSIMEHLTWNTTTSDSGSSKDGAVVTEVRHCAIDMEPMEDPAESVSPDLFAASEPPSPARPIDEEEEVSLDSATPVETDAAWRGVPLSSMASLFQDSRELGDLTLADPSHSVHFQIPVSEERVPTPHPASYEDRWDAHHVKMPCSPSNIYPVTEEGRSLLKPRWALIEEAYGEPIGSSLELERRILRYNGRYAHVWNFAGLHGLVDRVLPPDQARRFFDKTLPGIVRLALSVGEWVTRPPALLVRQRRHSLSLSQSQIARLLANAFLCTYPRRNTQKKQSEFASYPDINFVRLFENKSKSKWIDEKIKCLLHYFERVLDKEPTGVVTFARHVLTDAETPDWAEVPLTLTDLHVSSDGTIEKEGAGLVQVDFANRFVGGGVLGWGCVQEEIRFVICPELIAARLFTEAMDDNEALTITGCEQYCRHSGYSQTFRFEGDHVDATPRDGHSRRLCKVVAMNALKFRQPNVQYQRRFLLRELNKAYVGLRSATAAAATGSPAAVATGNWGCGAYRGDARLKGLLQLMAASLADRDVAYFTFGDARLRDDLHAVHAALVERRVTVGRLFGLLAHYGDLYGGQPSPPTSPPTATATPALDLYGYLYAMLDADSDASQPSPAESP